MAGKGYFLMKKPKNIAITGASSGLGAALAHHYADAGAILHLHGRNQERLEQVAAGCRRCGATVHADTGDVTDAASMSSWLFAADARSPIDLVIANAGISAGIGSGGESGDQAREIFSVNIGGVMNTVYPLLPKMIERRRGQIAIISSLAGLRGLPSSPAYSASKAAVRAWGEGLRGWLSTHDVEVSVVCPGFIKTPMTDVNPYRMPFMMEAGRAAAIIAAGLAKNKSRIAFPWQLYFPLQIMSWLPMAFTDPLFARLPDKPSL